MMRCPCPVSADTTKEGSLTGTICITYGSESADIIVNKAIAKLSSSVYSFTEGAYIQWTQGSGKEITFSIENYFDKFVQLKVNGIVLDASNYRIIIKKPGGFS